MWELLKDFLLVSMGMGIGIVLMCILSVGKGADYEMKKLKKEIHLNGSLLRPLTIGQGALVHAGGKIYHTSRVQAIHEQTDIRVLLTGEISDELFGYKYTDFAPGPERSKKNP